MKNVYFFYSGKYYIENKEFEYISNILKPMYELGPIDMSYFYYNSKHIYSRRYFKLLKQM